VGIKLRLHLIVCGEVHDSLIANAVIRYQKSCKWKELSLQCFLWFVLFNQICMRLEHVSSGSSLKLDGSYLEWKRNWGCRTAIASLFFEYFKFFLLSFFTTVLVLVNVWNGLDLNEPSTVCMLSGIYYVCRPFFLNRIFQFPTKREEFKNSEAV